MENKNIPDIVVGRLPLYLQTLNQMAREGFHIASSTGIAERLGTTAAQIRKDLSYFGGFGKQGTGYQLFLLIDELQKILNVDRIWQAAIVGAGDLGHALIHYQGFARHGFDIVLAFDNDPAKVGTVIGPIVIKNIDVMEEEIKSHGIKVGLITVPARNAQEIAERIVACGIKAILNYAPTTLILPEGIQVQNVDPILYLQKMTYYLSD